MDLSTKNWLWLEQVAAKASKDHLKSLVYAKSFEYAVEQEPSAEEVFSSVRNIITDPSRYIQLPQMMPGSQKTKNLYEKMTRQYLMDANY